MYIINDALVCTPDGVPCAKQSSLSRKAATNMQAQRYSSNLQPHRVRPTTGQNTTLSSLLIVMTARKNIWKRLFGSSRKETSVMPSTKLLSTSTHLALSNGKTRISRNETVVLMADFDRELSSGRSVALPRLTGNQQAARYRARSEMQCKTSAPEGLLSHLLSESTIEHYGGKLWANWVQSEVHGEVFEISYEQRDGGHIARVSSAHVQGGFSKWEDLASSISKN